MTAAHAPAELADAAALDRLLLEIGMRREDTGGAIRLIGADPVVDSRHRLGLAAASAVAAAAAGAAAIWRERTGEGQDIEVDLRRAAVPGLRSIYHIRQNGHAHDVPPRSSYPPASFFTTRDGRPFYVLRAIPYAEKILKTLDLLGCSFDPQSMAAAVARRDALELEDALAERGLVGVIARERDEWLSHPQGAWLASRPVIDIVKMGDGERRPFAPGPRPLSGIRVLDLTHVLAGPVVSRTLAEQGASVLHILAQHHADPVRVAIDTGLGKRSAFLDLDAPDQTEAALRLADGADVFVQSWRPGSLERRGFGPRELAERNPGLVYVSVSCYGSEGPWATRAGYEPCGQAACGFAVEEGSREAPRMAVTGTMNDYLVGYLAAAGVSAALLQRAREGGSYHVRVSLTRASMWLLELGGLPREAWPSKPLPLAVDPAHMIEMDSPFGRLTIAGPIAQYSRTPAFWATPPEPFGAALPTWDAVGG